MSEHDYEGTDDAATGEESLVDNDVDGYEPAVAVDDGVYECRIIMANLEMLKCLKDTPEEYDAPIINISLVPVNASIANPKRVYHMLWRPKKGDKPEYRWSAQDKIVKFLAACGYGLEDLEGFKYSDLAGTLVYANLGQQPNYKDPTELDNFVKYFTAPPKDGV